MEKEKIINPKTGKKIDMYGIIYNGLIREGYQYENGELVKPKLKFVESDDELEESEEESEEESIDYEDDDEEYELDVHDVEETDFEPKKERYIPEEEDEDYYEEQNYVTESIYPTYYERRPTMQYERMSHVRCIECNKPISILEKSFKRLKSQGLPSEEIYKRLNLKRVCCRMHLERPPIVNFVQANEEKMMDYPSTKVINVKKSKTLTHISQNPFFDNTNVNVNTNIRQYEHGQPTQTQINYQQLKTRPLGRKYQVSYIGK